MKTNLFSFIFLFASFFAFAQNDYDCQTELSLYAESAKVKNYEEALQNYNNLIEHCEDFSIVTYQYGKIIFKGLLKAEKNEEQQIKLAKRYIANEKARMKQYPEQSDKGDILSGIAQVMKDYNIGTERDQFLIFDEAWTEDQENFTNPKSIYTYFLQMVNLLDEGEFELQEVFQKYDEIQAHLEELENQQALVARPLIEKQNNQEQLTSSEQRNLKNAELRLKNYDVIRNSVDKVIGSRADCENLIPMFERDFEENKNDIEWIGNAADRLFKKECTDSDFFVQVVAQQHKLEPSAKSALYLGQLSFDKKDINQAMKYFKESAELEENKPDKAKVYYRIANTYKDMGNYSNARNYYKKAVQNQPSLGIVYLKVADMYAKSANDCGDDTFTKQAVYWLAAEYASKAGRVSPKLKSNANQAVESYTARAPKKSDVFQKNYSGGEKIEFNSCWIKESVLVPNL
ncbi:MAG: tetratricopeptide repeat protein [Flavobacteriaceae bacterium]|nr:tetratricopeptide repeat protein [Flavobacteriaceae bacterium]